MYAFPILGNFLRHKFWTIALFIPLLKIMIRKIGINISKVLLLLLFAAGCKAKSSQKSKYESTDMYDVAAPKVLNLPQALDEISGITYYARDTSVFAIIDEDGMLYKIPLKNPQQIKEWTYDKPRDFEDVVLKDSIFYVLVSNGDVETLKFKGDKIITDEIDFPDASKKTNEFESLYYDADAGKIIMMCKQCEEDRKKKITSYSLNDSSRSFVEYAAIPTEQMRQMLGVEKEHIKPSAAAINPITKELYILCSVNKILMITDNKGTVKKIIKLDPKVYKQPEGLTFTPDGDMIISNEMLSDGYGQLLLIKNKKKG